MVMKPVGRGLLYGLGLLNGSRMAHGLTVVGGAASGQKMPDVGVRQLKCGFSRKGVFQATRRWSILHDKCALVHPPRL